MTPPTPPTPTRLSSTVRSILSRLGLTQSSLARAAEVDRGVIHQLINKNHRPKRAILARIGEVLGQRALILDAAGYPDAAPVDLVLASTALSADGQIVAKWLTEQSPNTQRRARELIDLVFVRGWM